MSEGQAAPSFQRSLQRLPRLSSFHIKCSPQRWGFFEVKDGLLANSKPLASSNMTTGKLYKCCVLYQKGFCIL
eukprot:1154244-Pelagomonas_calceolata.AAC.1